MSKGRYKHALIVAFGIYTGLRISDILSLHWDQVMDVNRLVLKEQKTGKKRQITLHPDLIKLLDHVYNNTICCYSDYIFSRRDNRNKPMEYHGVNKALKKCFAEHNVHTDGNISSHCLRKTFGRRVFESNGESDKSLIILSSIFRHSSTEITRRYLGISDEEIADIYKTL